MFYLPPSVRIVAATLIWMFIAGCDAAPVTAPPASTTNSANSGGSVRVNSATPPAGEPGELTVSGAVNGTNRVNRQACESSGTTYRRFTLTTDGNVAGRLYFFSISVYPYLGPGTYELRPLPGRPMTHDVTPNPFLDQAPAYPGFLNFVPKSRPGNAYSFDAQRSAVSTMAVDPGAATGWFDLGMVSVNQTGEPLHLRVTGRFVCGPVFTPFPEMTPF
jgi:hypothetical protein